MLKQFKFTVDCIVSVHDITRQDAERVYRGDPNVGCYLEDPEALKKVIEQQNRLLYAILQSKEVLRRLVWMYVYRYAQAHLYPELPKLPEVGDEMFLVMAEAVDALDFVDRVLYLAYAAPRPGYEVEEDGDPFEQHTRLIRDNFDIELFRAELTDVGASVK